MSAEAKLAKLSTLWLVYAAVAVVVDAIEYRFDVDWLIISMVRLAIVFGAAKWLTNALLQQSSLVWAFGVVFGLLGGIAGVIVAVRVLVELVDSGYADWSLLVLSCASAAVHFQTFRVLRDGVVKRHVMRE